jgi:site-specific DNA recombinase
MAADGTPIHGGRVIDEPEAHIVRQIFRDFAAGKSPRKIAFDLNHLGVSGPRNTAWGPSTINGNKARGSGIFNNEVLYRPAGLEPPALHEGSGPRQTPVPGKCG